MKYTTFRNLLLISGASVVIAAGAYACSRGSSGSSASGLPSSSSSALAPTAPATVLVVTPPDPSPAAPVTSAPASAANALRPVDRDILAWRKTATVTGDKAKDVFPGKPYKVDGYKDEGKPGISRVKVDLDRDGKWDEKWDFEGDKVKRKVAPADDENYQQEFRLEGEAWRPKG